ncbi:MAG: methionyl-tRNA formyltransferase [Clostridia bacterium]
MNIIFMGTPDFAVPSLEELLNAGHNILRVYSQPDKPKGRGHKFQETPVKECALKNNLEVFQPAKIKDEAVINEIKALNPDCIVVVAYGKILPKAILDIPKKGCVNVHGSLLPMYRGAAPIQWAVLNGDKTTGVTTMYMGEGMDTGDMLLKEETEIGEHESSGELFDRLKIIGAKLLVKTLAELDNIVAEKQDDSLATHAPMISKDMAEIDFSKTANEIKNLVYGLKPWPCAKTKIEDKTIKVFDVDVINEQGETGKFFVKNKKLCVYCKENALQLNLIQPENKKPMSGESYLLGRPLKG